MVSIISASTMAPCLELPFFKPAGATLLDPRGLMKIVYTGPGVEAVMYKFINVPFVYAFVEQLVVFTPMDWHQFEPVWNVHDYDKVMDFDTVMERPRYYWYANGALRDIVYIVVYKKGKDGEKTSVPKKYV